MDLTTTDIKVQNEVQMPEPAKVSTNERAQPTRSTTRPIWLLNLCCNVFVSLMNGLFVSPDCTQT